MGTDMTKGNLAKSLVLFTIPLVLSGLLQQLFNWVDGFIVGNVEGETALAGIGATTSLYYLFLTVMIGFTSGLSVLAAQQYGMGEEEKIRRTLSTFVVVLGGLFLLIAALGIPLTSWTLALMDTPEAIFTLAKNYMQILFLGVPFMAVYNTYSAVLRGLGDSRASFLAVLVSTGINVALDVLFVVVLRWGVEGAAAATVVSQAAMTVYLALYAAERYQVLRFRIDREMIEGTILKRGLQFGLPPAIQAGVTSAGNLVLQRFMNGFGEQTVAAITTAYRVDSVLLLPIINFGSGIATVVGQNIGAGDQDRAKRTLKIGALLMAGISVCLTVLILLTGEYLIAMFGLTAESVAVGKSFFYAIAGFYLVYGLAMAFRGYLEGLGDMTFSGAAGIFSLLVRIAASYGLAGIFGTMIIAYAEAFSWAALLVLYLVRFYHKTRRRVE